MPSDERLISAVDALRGSLDAYRDAVTATGAPAPPEAALAEPSAHRRSDASGRAATNAAATAGWVRRTATISPGSTR